MSAEDLDNFESDAELHLYREYRDVLKLFKYVVEVDRRFYLTGTDVYFELTLTDAWVWDVYRTSRFIKSARVVTFKDINVEELSHSDADMDIPSQF